MKKPPSLVQRGGRTPVSAALQRRGAFPPTHVCLPRRSALISFCERVLAWLRIENVVKYLALEEPLSVYAALPERRSVLCISQLRGTEEPSSALNFPFKEIREAKKSEYKTVIRKRVLNVNARCGPAVQHRCRMPRARRAAHRTLWPEAICPRQTWRKNEGEVAADADDPFPRKKKRESSPETLPAVGQGGSRVPAARGTLRHRRSANAGESRRPLGGLAKGPARAWAGNLAGCARGPPTGSGPRPERGTSSTARGSRRLPSRARTRRAASHVCNRFQVPSAPLLTRTDNPVDSYIADRRREADACTQREKNPGWYKPASARPRP
ncbi:uncharacterized protein [Struthio camelus]|uniref:uncharacterized protein n=1 Tax=Struthio camelus TaxID=8801 RepID=UPI003603DE2E